MPFTVEQLPTVNALLNLAATILLIVGFVLIKQRRERAHKNVMLSAFGTSVLFLVFYLIYHYQIGGGKKFVGPPNVRLFYLGMLATHVVLAAIVPFLAGFTIYFGLKDQRTRHLRIAKWTFPIWLYVSITGVLIYLMLYVFFPSP